MVLSTYDVIVIGGGHAGCEAAAAAARMGSNTLLITMDLNRIAQMSCNPAVGGIAKGQIVREIDALGGMMGIVADKTTIQFRMLNRSKGPAMWSPRAQCDKNKFSETWRFELEKINNLFFWQGTVIRLLLENNRVIGVETEIGIQFHSKSVIVTSGTFLNGLMHFGKSKVPGGRISESSSTGITEQLASCGISTGRMKTGTPVRIDKRTIDFSRLKVQDGEKHDSSNIGKFSYLPDIRSGLKQLPCYITYTNKEVHEILESGFNDSPMFNGAIKSIGPRYCPSIETKLVIFKDKEQHQLFLEPEGVDSIEYYLNGFSSSLPWNIQNDAVHKIEGLENAKLIRPGYAIEYDFFDPTQLHPTLESKIIENLFFAGQVNGTTGYEEAGAQGLIAGVNAHRKIDAQETFVLKRNEAYIGVLIDDLVTKGVDEPYRMFTSRAEYRLLLRQDNADVRLTEIGYELGLATEERLNFFKEKVRATSKVIGFCKTAGVKAENINDFLEGKETARLKRNVKIESLVMRPQLTIFDIAENVKPLKNVYSEIAPEIRDEVFQAAEIEIKYSGYIERETALADKLVRLEGISIDSRFNYEEIISLSTEARQKLARIQPKTIGQASRIPGISPSDINVLLVMMGR